MSGLGATDTFCWMDVKTRDVAGTGDFLSKVFGWHFAVDEDDWRRAVRITFGGWELGTVSDLARPVYPPGTPAHVAFYLRVEDVERRAEAAVEHGARLLLPPFEADGQGRIATLLDPFGAAFSLWDPPPGQAWSFPAGTPGTPCRMLLVCADPLRARAFYRGFLGAEPAACDFLPTADPGPASWEAAIAVPDPESTLALAHLDAPAPAGGSPLPSLSTPDGITFRLLPEGC